MLKSAKRAVPRLERLNRQPALPNGVASARWCSLSEVETFRRLVRERLGSRVLVLTLFGSRAEGRSTAASDVDVAVLPAGGGVEERLALACDVAELASRAFGVPEDRVDIVFLDDESLPIELLFKAVARGVLIYCRDAELYRDLRLRVTSKYLDFRVFKEKLGLTQAYLRALRRDLVGEGRGAAKGH